MTALDIHWYIFDFLGRLVRSGRQPQWSVWGCFGCPRPACPQEL